MRVNTLLYSFAIVAFGCSGNDNPNPFTSANWIDLTHDFSAGTLVWPTSEPFRLDTVFAGYTDENFYYEAYSFCTSEHGGTHLDAPIHFAEGRQRVHEVPLQNLIGPAALIDVSEKALGNRNYQITSEDILSWEEHHNLTVDDHILLFRTGYGQYWPDAESYMGTALRGQEGVAKLQFPGIHPETAMWLVENRNVKAVGLDTPSLDYGQSVLFETHQTLSKENIPGFENVANLDLLPGRGASIVALPMKIRDGSGAPLRIIAYIENN